MEYEDLMVYEYLAGFIVPIVISLLITPSVIWFAQRVGAMDQPNGRKIHKAPIPRLGGVAIYLSFFVSLALLKVVDPGLNDLISLGPDKGGMLIIAFVLILALGIIDDIHPRTPTEKLVLQLIAGTLVYLTGFRVSTITAPLGKGVLDLGILEYPATLLWIVGITNAFNLIDGLDGLATGVAAIACFTIFGVSLLTNELHTSILVLILAGAVIGFLRYNFWPARIFLGDSGSLFLGFALSVFSIRSSTKGSTAVAILVPILSLGLPIIDTMLAMTRRLLGSLLPERAKSTSFLRKLDSIFSPDTRHIHHRLIARGLSHRNAVFLLYIVSCTFGIGAFAITAGNNLGASAVLITVAVATTVGVRQLRYKEMAVLRNGIFLPIYEWPLINRRFFQGFLDLGFITIAYAAAYILRSPGETSRLLEKPFVTNAMIIGGMQLLVFYFSGLYKGTFRYSGIGDILKMFKAVVLAVTITGIAFSLRPQTQGAFGFSIAISDFYFLLSLVVGSRVSFHVLDYFFRRENGNGGKRVVIYGADAKGLLTLQQILSDDRLNLTPVGFLDEATHLEGKRLNGYPIFGGHWKIPKILRQHNVEEIILSGHALMPQVLQRLNKAARDYGIKVRKFQVDVVDVPSDSRAPSLVQSPLSVKTEGRGASTMGHAGTHS
jgi:UDP-GlcNAc:undecaprenyl-phosphate GlcNAc-1-phosphate transferase